MASDLSPTKRYAIALFRNHIVELAVLYPVSYVNCSDCPDFGSANPELIAQHIINHLRYFDPNVRIIITRICELCKCIIFSSDHFEHLHRYTPLVSPIFMDIKSVACDVFSSKPVMSDINKLRLYYNHLL